MSKSQILLLCATLVLSADSVGQSRKQCEHWSEQFQRLRELRRAGGSVGEMDRWRDQQRLIRAEMRKAQCMQRFRITASGSQVP